MEDVATIPLFLNREGAPVPSPGATPVKSAALSFGIERGTAGQAGLTPVKWSSPWRNRLGISQGKNFTGQAGFFGLSPFPEEREKTQSAFDGKTQLSLYVM